VLGNAVHFGVAETYPRDVVATILKSALWATGCYRKLLAAVSTAGLLAGSAWLTKRVLVRILRFWKFVSLRLAPPVWCLPRIDWCGLVGPLFLCRPNRLHRRQHHWRRPGQPPWLSQP